MVVLALALGGCGDDSPDSVRTKPRPRPVFEIGGRDAGKLRRSRFVSCLESSGFKVKITPDRSPDPGIADVYFYDDATRTPRQKAKIDRCSGHLLDVLRRGPDDLGVAIPDVQRAP